MPSESTAAQVPAEPSSYLTDGTGLYRVVRADPETTEVLLEDCCDPSGTLVCTDVASILADRWRVVTPAP